MSRTFRSVYTKSVDVTVEVDVRDVLDRLTTQDLLEELAARGFTAEARCLDFDPAELADYADRLDVGTLTVADRIEFARRLRDSAIAMGGRPSARHAAHRH